MIFSGSGDEQVKHKVHKVFVDPKTCHVCSRGAGGTDDRLLCRTEPAACETSVPRVNFCS